MYFIYISTHYYFFSNVKLEKKNNFIQELIIKNLWLEFLSTFSMLFRKRF